MVSLGRFTAARAATLLVGVVGVVSILTGIANIATPTRVTGPLAGVVPPAVAAAAGFTGTLTGFLLLLSAFGMRRGLRAAWLVSLALLPITLTQGLIQTSELSIPLIVLSAVTLPSVWVSRGRFDRALSLSPTQYAAGTAIVAVQLYGTAGTFALRREFANVDTVLDAFYYTLVTASTVGYGDAIPTSQTARLFSLTVLLLGVASFGVAISALLAPAIEARFSEVLGRMTQAQLELLEDHVIVLGYGELTEPIVNELGERSTPFVVVTDDESAASRLSGRPFDLFRGDPSDEATLRQVNVDSARAVVTATNDDGRDALAILTARELDPDVWIVAAAAERENVAKLRRAGADTVVSPAAIGGHLLVESALGGHDADSVVDRVVRETSGGDGTAGEDESSGLSESERR